MPTRKIDPANPWPEPCRSPEHYPPTMVVWAPGTYEHECPSCHNIIRFVVVMPITDCSTFWTRAQAYLDSRL